MSETILKTTNVSKVFGKHKVLDKVSIEIKRGMIDLRLNRGEWRREIDIHAHDYGVDYD